MADDRKPEPYHLPSAICNWLSAVRFLLSAFPISAFSVVVFMAHPFFNRAASDVLGGRARPSAATPAPLNSMPAPAPLREFRATSPRPSVARRTPPVSPRHYPKVH